MKHLRHQDTAPAEFLRDLPNAPAAAQRAPFRPNGLSRREWVTRSTGLLGAALLASQNQHSTCAEESAGANQFGGLRFCLNTATIRGQRLGILREVEVAAAAGYHAIEPWVSSVEDYQKGGGSLSDLKKRIADAGLSVESSIAFAEWIVDDDSKRARGMEAAKRQMDLVAQIGGKRFAAPPVGATNLPRLDLDKVAERYRALLEAGDQLGVVPELELWGFSKNLHLLSECAYVAIQTGHPRACVLADMFHLYKGGTPLETLKLLSGDALQVFHMNDYPLNPPREKIDDSYRIFPGDGAAPLVEVLRVFQKHRSGTVLSLELFSQKYWAQDPVAVAKAGLAKMKAVAAQAQS